VRVLFIGGFGRSGSTLIERILGELPGICALGEVALLWQRVLRDDVRCGCGAPFSECEFWSVVGDKAFGGWRNVDTDRVLGLQNAVGRNRHIPWLAGRRLNRDRLAMVAEYTDYYTRIYAATASVTGARVVIDSSKNPGLAFCLRWARGLDLRVVHLVRDARGVAYSSTKHVPRPETDGAASLPRHRPAVAAFMWSAQNVALGLLARVGRERPGQGQDQEPHRVPMCRIRYEEFLDDPRRAVRRIAAFAGLDPAETDLSCLDRAGYANLDAVHNAAGNPMRFTTGWIPLRRDDVWRTELPPWQRRLVAAICAPLLATYGYPLAPGHRPAGHRPASHRLSAHRPPTRRLGPWPSVQAATGTGGVQADRPGTCLSLSDE
jgi:hypothetical protein